MMDYINAFWVGGVICALAQIFLDRTKMLPGRVMVLRSAPARSSASSGGTSRLRSMRVPVQTCRSLDMGIFS